MRQLTAQSKTGPFTALLSLLLVPLSAYANLLCVAGGAAFDVCEHHETDSDCAGTDASHHDGAPPHPAKDCSKDSCFCATMNAVTSPQTIVKPGVTHSVRLLDLSLPVIPNVIPQCAAAAYEHGPSGIAPPLYLSTHALSSRAPPCLA